MRRFPVALAGAAAVFALVVPSALASGNGRHHHCAPSDSSAVNIYVQQLPTSCGSSTVGRKTSGGQSSSLPSVPLPKAAGRALKHTSAKNRKVLKTLATDPMWGAQPPVHFDTAAMRQPPPSAVGAAFDLGSGPIALFIALLAGAALGALGGSLQRRRR